jgi:antitoxin component of MazEF toxin-antitoxin module
LKIIPLYSSRSTLEQLLPQITDDNIHHEIDTGPAVGEEKWERGED